MTDQKVGDAMMATEGSAKLTDRFVTVLERRSGACLSLLLYDVALFAYAAVSYVVHRVSGGSRGNAMTTRGVMRKRLFALLQSGGADRCRCRSGTAASR
jgi:hypothetical protein